MERNVNKLVGETLVDIVVNDNHIKFILESGEEYEMYHEQDCCESVYIESIVGDLDDIKGSPLLLAEEVNETGFDEEWGEGYTWTFYRFRTFKGLVVIRWYGSSNGYYSENVDFYKIR